MQSPCSGEGVSTNPHWDGNEDHPRSKVWARGFRNPFRISMKPGGTTPPYVGDVGWGAWEEVSALPAGANAGWPCFEGNHVQSGFSNKPPCTTLAASSVQMPLIEWDHSGGDTAVVSGTFYTGTAYPAEYQGAYFYGDYSRGWIKRARVTANDTLVPAEDGGGPFDFATSLSGPV